MNRSFLATMVVSIFLPLHIGCTSSTAHVEGTVALDGQPAQEGYVTFRCIDKDKPAFNTNCTIENGRYSSRNTGIPLPMGDYEVRVAVMKKTGRQVPVPARPDHRMQDEVVLISAEDYNSSKSPLKYHHQAESTLDIEVPAKK